jgi:hypothetical protein
MMCKTEIVVTLLLARVSMGALATAAWLIFSVWEPGSLQYKVCAHTSAKIVMRAWSTGGDRAYRTGKSWWYGGVDLQLLQDESPSKPATHFQCRSGACA